MMVPVGELESCESLATKACRGGAGFRRGISQEVHLPAILLKYHTAGLGAVSPANALELSRQKLHNSKFGANTRGIGPAARETLAPNPNSKVPSTVMTAIGMYVRDSSLKHARELAAVAIPAAPRGEARRSKAWAFALLVRLGAKCGREAKKSARGKVWHSVAPQEDGSAPGRREDIGGDVWAAEDTVICHGQYAVGGQKGKTWVWIMIRQMWIQRASTRPHTAGWNEQDEGDDGVYGCASTGARV